MANVDVSIPKGMRDFAPEVMARRNYIFDTIRHTFHAYGYQPIETPAMENLSTLLGKYGDEGDKLLFRVLNSGDFLKETEGKDLYGMRREELAALLDVPADELQKTIDRYNELCDQGIDADFGKKSAYMHKIEKAPFWGVRKHIRVSSIDSGVNTNANGQALDADGKVIEGLYCVGNVGGVFYGGADYPFHQTGLSLGRCYTFGMLAAKHAMGK